MSDFKKALLWTAVPIASLSLLSTAVAMVSGTAGAVFGFGLTGALVYMFGAFIALIVFIVKRRNRVAAGIIAGIGIGIVAMGVTCFAAIANI